MSESSPSAQPRSDLTQAIGLLRRLEFCVDDSARTGKDVYRCPICGGGYMPGVDGKHESGCELETVLRKHRDLD